MADDLLTGQFQDILNLIAAAGALGTASYGLVDASKAFMGGMSNPGFGYIRKAVAPLLGPGPEGSVFGRTQILETLRAHWLNGVPKADQKASAKALVRQGLTPENAARLAQATGVNAAELQSVAGKIRDGTPLVQQDLNILGRFDTVVSAVLDLGYERADQLYRNAAKAAASATAIVLAVIAGGVIYLHNGGESATIGRYIFSNNFLLALLVGAISTPLAPVAKDLSTTLQAAAKAMNLVRR